MCDNRGSWSQGGVFTRGVLMHEVLWSEGFFSTLPRKAGGCKAHAYTGDPGMTAIIPAFLRSGRKVTGTGTTSHDGSPEGCTSEAFSH